MKLRRPISHVIFDLDGVLLDTEPAYTRATQEIIGPYGKTFDWSLKGNMIGKSSLEGARYLMTALELPMSAEEYLERRRPRLEELFSDAPEIPGARAFTERLHAHGVPLGVATSSETALYRLKVGKRPWFSMFRAVVCGDDPRIRELKPAPDIFLLTAGALGAPAEGCLVFEDSPAGIQAAVAAGMQVIALPDAQLDRARVAAADLVIESFEQLALEDLGF